MAHIAEDLYETESENNNALAQDLIGRLFPGIDVGSDHIFQILSYLSETGVNAQVLPRVIRGIHNLTLGTGEGEVIVHVRKDTLTIETKERDGEIRTKNI